MGNSQNKSNVKINFKEHLKIQKELIFNQQITKGSKPIKGRIKQSGQRDSYIPHINHQSIESHRNYQPNVNNEAIINSNIKNPKISHQALLPKSNQTLLDNRTKSQYDKYPFTCIGLLQVQFENRKIRGTGFLISSNWLLTCAHNLYDREKKKMGTNATFTLALQQKDQIIKENNTEYKTIVDIGQTIEISTWRLPDQYMQLDDQQALLYDFALVKLKNFYNLQEKYGFFGLDSTWAFNKNNHQNNLIIAGYPKQLKSNLGKCKYLVQGVGPWSEILTFEKGQQKQCLLYLNYKIFTSPGQSGSPIFYQSKQNEYFMIGIHTLGGDQQNSGLLMTPKARQIINGWMEQMKTIFDISNRNIADEGMQQFINNFINISIDITELQLANNRIGPKGIHILMNTKWTKLKLLNLQNNNLKLEGAQHLAHPMHGWNSLEYLNLNNTMIGDEGCCILIANRTWTKLKELHLKRCSLTKKTINQIAQNQWPALQTLNLAINQLTSGDIATLFTPLTQQKKRFARLNNLILTKNSIGNGGIEAIVKGGYELQQLIISGINADQQGINILSKGKWPRLKRLHIDWNKSVSIQGIKFITPSIYPNLTYINLDWTTLGSVGVKELMSYSWTNLKFLSLNHDYLGDTGLNQIKSYNTIEVLVLQGNNITSEGVIIFSQKPQWKHLMQLKLRSNHINKNGFTEIISNLRNLNYLDINNNGLDAHQKRELKELSNKINPNLHIQVDMAEQADYT